jgi:hypothetical protein
MNKLLLFALIVCSALATDAQVTAPPAMTADEVMARVFVRDRQRERLSQGYVGQRRYVFDNANWHKHAELLVAVTAGPDGTKNFEVLSEEGWRSANHHVLKKMMESEAETSHPTMRPKTLLTPENYTFSLVQTEQLDGRPTYVIGVLPKRHDKYLFEGRIWVDASDFALVRCEGKPAKNPSFWTRSIQFVHQYQKNNEFWFPRTTESVTEARIFGTTKVEIHYFDYAPNSIPSRQAATPPNAPFDTASYVSTH